MALPRKDRSRLDIMHYILSFCISHASGGDKRIYGGIEGFISSWDDETPAQPGDLVIIKSAPVSKWTIGWLEEIDTSNPNCRRYAIESLEDGQICWWHNIGIEYFPRDKLHPSWRWTDKQWEFQDRWNRVCFKERDAYINLPIPPVFGEDFSVTLGTRTRFGFDDIRPTRTFPDWRKVTKAIMAQCYDECVAEHDTVAAERKKEGIPAKFG
jgi:hypothetical protein